MTDETDGQDGGVCHDDDLSPEDYTTPSGDERVECWRCGYQRLIYESCPECGGSCKPLTKEKQQKESDTPSTEL